MADLMLVSNPKRRRRRKHARRRSNPHHRRRAHRRSHRRHRARRRNPSFRRIRRYSRRRRSNPLSLGGFKGAVLPTVKEGFVGAAGALMLDAAWGYINPKLPATISGSPYLQFAVKCLAAVGVGMLGGKLLRGKARDLAVGGVTVAAHDMLKSVLQTSLPTVFGSGGTLALSGYGHMGAYLSGSAPVVGTATFPRTHTLPYTRPGSMGAYLSGSTGVSDGAGVFVDDQMGFDPWEG
jgi:hypothetical protein